MKKMTLFTAVGAIIVGGMLVGCSAETVGSAINSSDAISNNSECKVYISGNEINVEGNGCDVNNGVIVISQGGKYQLSGESNQCAVLVNTKDSVELVLDGIDLTNPTGPVIYGEKEGTITINVSDGTENYISDGDEYDVDDEGKAIGNGVISSEGSIYITGAGDLTITGNYKHGVFAEEDIVIDGGNINVEANGTDGIHADKEIIIEDGNINIVAESDMMEAEAKVTINGGSIIGTSKDEGIEGKESVTINGGTIDISVEDDGINAGESIVINDGDITIFCNKGDAIDSNGSAEGSITINGGYVYAMGGEAPEGGLDSDNSSVLINGGTVIASGAVNSPISEESEQIAVVYGQYAEGTELKIVDENGNTVFSFTPENSGTTIIISVPELEADKVYSIYSGNELTMSITTDTSVVQAGGSASGMGGGMRNMDDPNREFDSNNMPEGFNPENMPERFDSENMPEGFDPNNMPQRDGKDFGGKENTKRN